MSKCGAFESAVAIGFTAFVFSQAALADAPEIPSSEPLSASEIVALLSGRTFEFTGYDEPIVGKTNWNFDAGKVTGTYVWDGSKAGEFDVDAFINDENQLCTVQSSGTVCQVVYEYESGFMEVTPSGEVHAVSVPLD